MQVKAIAWNLFHGRDFPPDPALFTWRSRLLRATERNDTHVQVNRDLREEFCRLLAAAEWDVALLQECPPRWRDAVARACEAEPHMALTSRNSFGALRALAARLNPDLVAAGEGGSNLTLVRGPNAQRASAAINPSYRGIKHSGTLNGIAERREVTIHEGRPERRAMALTRIGQGDGPPLCVANLHATNDRPEVATEDVLHAAEAATAWAGDAPLIFGGDLNLRLAETPGVFEELRERFGLAGPTAPDAIDHLLVRGLEVVEPPHPCPPERRELPANGRTLRLSDHAPVAARFATSAAR
jgi:hypothetical protein